jgi:CCR4-NOT transcription complex subunit 1
MNLDPLSFSLAQINYLITNLNKRNFKASQAELQSIIETSGSGASFEAERHLFRYLLSNIDFNIEPQQQQQTSGSTTPTTTSSTGGGSSTPTGKQQQQQQQQLTSSIGKDHHQIQLLREYLCAYLTKPHFPTLLCYCIENPLQSQEVPERL